MRRAWLAVLALACAEAGVDAPADSSGFQPGDTSGTPGVPDAADPEPSADTAQEPQDVAQAPEVLPTDTGALDIGAPDDGALSDAGTPDAALVDAWTPDVALDDTSGDTAGDTQDADAPPSLPPPFGDPPEALTVLPALAGSFAEGVATGDPSRDGAVVWTRYTGPGQLNLEVYQDGAESPAKTVALVPGEDGTAQVVLDTLLSNTRYFYAFVVSGGPTGRSPIGRFRTAPAHDALVPVRLVHTGDAKALYMPYHMGEPIALEEGLAFWIFNGDTVYADGSSSLDDYREHYRVNWSEPHLRTLRAAAAYTHTWDDHEFTNNFEPWAFGLLDTARQAYFEYHPTRRPPDEPNRLWRSVRWGRTVEVIVLDCRTERTEDKSEYLSEAQMSWLEERLASTDTVFKLIVSSAPIGIFLLSSDDRWEGYPTHRKRILDFISQNGLTNVYWLTADFHATVLHTLENGSWEFIAGPIGMTLLPVWNALNGQPGVDYASGDYDNYHVLDLDPVAQTLTLTVKDEFGVEKYTNVYPH